MIADNPLFKNNERAVYELGHLLLAMPGALPRNRMLTVDERNSAEAIAKHACNANYAVIHGIEVIGNLLVMAASGGQSPEEYDVMSIGGLVQHLAVEAQFLQEQMSDLARVLQSDDELRIKAAPARKGAPA